MQIYSATRGALLGALLLAVFSTVDTFSAAGQTAQNSESLTSSQPLSQPSKGGDQIFAELVKHNELRSARLREYSELRTYSVVDLKGKVHARETVRMEYAAPDKKSFVMVAEEGSAVVRHLVLSRLMESETSAAAGQE